MLAPIVLKRAISNCLVYTPIVSILFIMIALKIKRLTIINFNTTPINIPKYPITIKLLAIGISDLTEKSPIFDVTFAPKELKSS